MTDLVSGPLFELTALDSADDSAALVLARTWAGDDRTLQLPIDPIAIARRLGADVFTATLDVGVSAMLVGEPDKPARIYLNLADAGNRQRFSCAHEIGHLLRRRQQRVTSFGFVDRRDHIATLGTDPEERWANRFAASLLMPASLLQGAPSDQPEHLAQVFGVSSTAMRIRLDTWRWSR